MFPWKSHVVEGFLNAAIDRLSSFGQLDGAYLIMGFITDRVEVLTSVDGLGHGGDFPDLAAGLRSAYGLSAPKP